MAVNTIQKPNYKSGYGKSLYCYNLKLPEEMYAEIRRLSDEQHTTVLDIIRRFIRFGLFASEMQKEPGTKLLIRQNNAEHEIHFF